MRIIQALFLIFNLVWAKNLSAIDSWSALFEDNGKTHATPHITNIIRSSPDNLNDVQIKELEKLDIHVENNTFLIERPEGLNETYATDHFKFHFILDDSYNSVENIEYVISMGNVFENVWEFYVDSLGYYPPIEDQMAGGSNLYDIYLVNLPSGYFGITYTSTAQVEEPACASFIKMRNS